MNRLLTFTGLLLFCSLFIFACKSKQKAQTKETQKVSKKKSTSQTKASTSNASEEELKRLLGLSSKEIKKNSLYRFIEDWYGTPYKYGGCKKSGVDCSCFTNILYEEVYHKQLIGNAADIYKSTNKISLRRAKEGDLVFFKINVSYVSHVGVLLRNDYFVHASTSKGVMVSNLNEAYYKKYFHSAGRFTQND